MPQSVIVLATMTADSRKPQMEGAEKLIPQRGPDGRSSAFHVNTGIYWNSFVECVKDKQL